MEIWKFSDTYYIDPAARRAYVLDADGNCKQDFDISANCFDFLQALVENRGQVLEYETLGRRAYGEDMYYKKDNLTTNLRQLKKSLGTKYGCPDVIKAVPKVGYRLDYLEKVAAIPAVPPRVDGAPPTMQTELSKLEGDSPAAPNDPPKTEAPRTLAPQQVLDLLYGSEAQRRAVLHRAPEVPQRAVAKTDFMTAVLPTFLLEAWQRLSAQQQTELLQGENRMGWWDARCQIQTDNYYSVEELVKNCRTLLQREVETHGLAQELIDLVRWVTAENDAYVPVERALFLSEADGYPERGVAIVLLAGLLGPICFADLFAGPGYRYFMQ